MKNILVTGGAGFIGSHLVDNLVTKGHKVAVVDDLSNGRIENLEEIFQNIIFLKHDVSKPFYNIDSSLPSMDVIYHLACFPRSQSFANPKRDVEVNINGMVNVLELARRNRAEVIFSSNSGIYDTSKIPIDERAADRPKTPYDLNKLTAERYLKLYKEVYGVPHVIFRFATVYGPRQRVSPDWKPVVMEFINKLSRGLAPTIYWDGEQTRDFIYVGDLVEALVKAMSCEETLEETMILGSGVETSINQLYEAVSNRLGVEISPKRESKVLGDIRRMRYDCGKAKRILNWEPGTTLKNGVDNILKDLKT